MTGVDAGSKTMILAPEPSSAKTSDTPIANPAVPTAAQNTSIGR
jgi:hypothetical protein